MVEHLTINPKIGGSKPALSPVDKKWNKNVTLSVPAVTTAAYFVTVVIYARKIHMRLTEGNCSVGTVTFDLTTFD